MAVLLAVRSWLRGEACAAISCCHSADAAATSLPSTLFGSTGVRQAQDANRVFRSSTAMRYSTLPGSGAVRGKPPYDRKSRALSAAVGSVDQFTSWS